MQKLMRADVEALAFDALKNAGASDDAAGAMALACGAAEMDGTRSHGLMYIPIYCEHLQCGKVRKDAQPSIASQSVAAIRVDADYGFAHPAIGLGFSQLVEKAKASGLAGLSVFNSYNCGVLGYHTENIAKEGLVGLGFTNAPASIAPVGGKKPVIGTNPYALSVPDGDGGAVFTLDQSASVVAKSEIILHSKTGKSIPEGWAFDADGRDTTDPAVALKGSMAPAGGYKGFGNGLMVEILAAALSGATLGKDASPFSGTAGGPPSTGQFFFAIDPNHFAGQAFHERINALVEAITQQDGARLPGARRMANRPENERNGVEVDDALMGRIQAFL